MSSTTIGKREIEAVTGLTRRLRNDPEVWPIFERVGFREYMTMEEVGFVRRKVSDTGVIEFNNPALNIKGSDWLISIGLLERLADGMLMDVDLEGEWVAEFISDRWHTPSSEGKSTCKPIELGWIMALAREIIADPKNIEYFMGLTDFQHCNPRERPVQNPIQNRKNQFCTKHCLNNRDTTLGIWPLLYSWHPDYAHLQSAQIDDITNIEQAKKALANRHESEPNITGGYNLSVYFEDLNR